MQIEIGDKLYFAHDDGWRAKVVEHVCLDDNERKKLKEFLKTLDCYSEEMGKADALIFLKTTQKSL